MSLLYPASYKMESPVRVSMGQGILGENPRPLFPLILVLVFRVILRSYSVVWLFGFVSSLIKFKIVCRSFPIVLHSLVLHYLELIVFDSLGSSLAFQFPQVSLSNWEVCFIICSSKVFYKTTGSLFKFYLFYFVLCYSDVLINILYDTDSSVLQYIIFGKLV